MLNFNKMGNGFINTGYDFSDILNTNPITGLNSNNQLGFAKYNHIGPAVPATADNVGGILNKATGANNGINWFGKNGIIPGLAMGLDALGGLANAYIGNKAYNLAKQQFGFQKALAQRNLANQAKIINNTYDNAAQVAAGMIGSRDANGNYGFTDPNLVNKYEKKANNQHVSDKI